MKIGVYYFGGQYNHLIVKTLKYMGHEIVQLSPEKGVDSVKGFDAIVFGGGPQSVYRDYQSLAGAIETAKTASQPKLGICLGHQVLTYALGGEVVQSSRPEYGLVTVTVEDNDTILSGIPQRFNAWESHSDEVSKVPPGFRRLAVSQESVVQAMVNSDNTVFGVQFHPEVKHTENGLLVFENFIRSSKR